MRLINGAFKFIMAAEVILTPADPFIKVPPAKAVKVKAPAATLIFATPAPTLTKNPDAPTKKEIGPATLFTEYRGTASAADPPGIIIISYDPAIIVKIPDLTLGKGGTLILRINDGVST